MLSVNAFNINLIDRIASSFPGIGMSTKLGTILSKIETIEFLIRHSAIVISRFDQ